ncbi:methyltransferase [Pseudooceanicola sp. CBS1P-1]|uniref:Methyltransferase n=2 Tax=Paracoccaceae TaxID=31989 RepID=A0A6L7G8Q7_9RHOB|nr:methyltransferase [Pseudooceanicola endophyticus]MXN20471.1 methyltransferase [Pseudooceanicola albus]
MAARLAIALEAGLDLSSGGIAVLAPRAGTDLSALPKDRLRIVTGFYPDYRHFKEAGHACAVGPDCAEKAEGGFAAVLVCLPREKALARALVAAACAMTTGPVILDGQKDDGIDSLLKEVRRRGPVEGPVNKAHGKLFWFPASTAFADWAGAPAQIEGGFVTAPGVFSADGVDPASALLAGALPELSGRVADLGAGWGYLSQRLAGMSGITSLDLVEADHAALACARRNIDDPRVHFHWADARDWKAPTPLDVIVMNPPFHTGRAADPELGRDFIRSAARNLAASGRLYMVANAHLGYEDTLQGLFGSVTGFGGTRSFKLLVAERPSRQAGRGRLGSGSGTHGDMKR